MALALNSMNKVCDTTRIFLQLNNSIYLTVVVAQRVEPWQSFEAGRVRVPGQNLDFLGSE